MELNIFRRGWNEKCGTVSIPQRKESKTQFAFCSLLYRRPALSGGAAAGEGVKKPSPPFPKVLLGGRGAGGGDIFFQEKSLPLHILPLLPIP